MNNFAVPTSLEGLSLGTILLALVGNGLMVPRALFTRDSIWLLGSAWGSAFGWLQMLSMFVGRSATGCAPTWIDMTALNGSPKGYCLGLAGARIVYMRYRLQTASLKSRSR